MLVKTRGIVLNHIKYRDTSIIVRIYTEAFGLQSYIVNNIRSAKAKPKMALYQPLTLLDLVVYKNNQKSIQRIAEVRCTTIFETIPYEVKKSAMAVFLVEVLNKVIAEDLEDHNEQFEFVFRSIELLDKLDAHHENFHLIFLLKLSHYLGFGIRSHEDVLPVLENVQKRELIFNLGPVMDGIIKANYPSQLEVSNVQRKSLLSIILNYYHQHLDSFNHLKSLEVLHQVLHD